MEIPNRINHYEIHEHEGKLVAVDFNTGLTLVFDTLHEFDKWWVSQLPLHVKRRDYNAEYQW